MKAIVRLAHAHPHVLAYMAAAWGIIMVWRLVSVAVGVLL